MAVFVAAFKLMCTNKDLAMYSYGYRIESTCRDSMDIQYTQLNCGKPGRTSDNNAVTIIPTELGAWIHAGIFHLSVSFLL